MEINCEQTCMGLKVKGLVTFIQECQANLGKGCFEAMTTRDVISTIVKPLTTTARVSYCEMLQTNANASDSISAREGSVLIIHAHSNLFEDLVECILNHFKGVCEATIWLDVFSLNQNCEETQKDQAWVGSIQRRIATFSQALVVGAPWYKPLFVSSTWCLFEIYLMRRGNCTFVLTERDKELLVESICTGGVIGVINSMLARVNILKSATFDPADKRAILEVVESRIGIDKLNSSIRKHVISWVAGVVAATAASSKLLPAKCALAQLLLQQELFREAEGLVRECLKESKKSLGTVHSCTVAMTNLLAAVYEKQSNYVEALSIYEACWMSTRKNLGENDVETLRAMNNVATVYDKSEELDVAQGMFQECITLSKVKHGPTNAATLAYTTNLALSFIKSEKKYGMARSLLDICLKGYSSTMGPKAATTLACMRHIATLHGATGDWGAAQDVLEECLVEYEAQLGADHPSSMDCRFALATSIAKQGCLAAALPVWEKCHRICSLRWGEDHAESISCALELAKVLCELDRFEDALPLLQRAVAARQAQLGSEHRDTLSVMLAAGRCLCELGDFFSAEQVLCVHHRHMCSACKLEEGKMLSLQSCRDPQSSLNLFTRHIMYEEKMQRIITELGSGHPKSLESMCAIAAVYMTWNMADSAVNILEECLRHREEALGEAHPDTLAAMRGLAQAHLLLQHVDTARGLFSRCLVYRTDVLGAEHPDTLQSMNDMGNCCRRGEDYHAGRELLTSCLNLRKFLLGDAHPDTLCTMSDLAELMDDMNETALAVEQLKECLAMRKAVLGMVHEDTRKTVALLAQWHRKLGHESLVHALDSCVADGQTEHSTAAQKQTWNISAILGRSAQVLPSEVSSVS